MAQEPRKPLRNQTEEPNGDPCLPDEDEEPSYYYDDAHGYETFDPDNNESDDDDEVTS